MEDDETVLNIVITPPFWETTWAYLLFSCRCYCVVCCFLFDTEFQ